MDNQTKAILSITAYETAAILVGPLPTISTLLMALPRPVRALIVASAALWLADHVEILEVV